MKSRSEDNVKRVLPHFSGSLGQFPTLACFAKREIIYFYYCPILVRAIFNTHIASHSFLCKGLTASFLWVWYLLFLSLPLWEKFSFLFFY